MYKPQNTNIIKSPIMDMEQNEKGRILPNDPNTNH